LLRYRENNKSHSLILVAVLIVVVITFFSIRPMKEQTAPVGVENLSPNQLQSLYGSEVAFNVTGQWNITINSFPGGNPTGSFSVQVFKACGISVSYLPYRFYQGSNVSSIPQGTLVSLSIPGKTSGMVVMPSDIVLNARKGTSLQFLYSISIPRSASIGSYSFQLVLVPKDSSYLARFFDVKLIVA
jgi:hypothetical protein